ncbi:hypothetical protein Fcan01_12260 [Folsomia candida]|uniref:Uncharacterized protein n=1 Tax=Folsomia candida TaxID=158441 RepID=A0A226E8I1_FOLCA|nr:hypothetical protein Fcan01_12260 [Folsomia candida]
MTSSQEHFVIFNAFSRPKVNGTCYRNIEVCWVVEREAFHREAFFIKEPLVRFLWRKKVLVQERGILRRIESKCPPFDAGKVVKSEICVPTTRIIGGETSSVGPRSAENQEWACEDEWNERIPGLALSSSSSSSSSSSFLSQGPRYLGGYSMRASAMRKKVNGGGVWWWRCNGVYSTSDENPPTQLVFWQQTNSSVSVRQFYHLSPSAADTIGSLHNQSLAISTTIHFADGIRPGTCFVPQA